MFPFRKNTNPVTKNVVEAKLARRRLTFREQPEQHGKAVQAAHSDSIDVKKPVDKADT